MGVYADFITNTTVVDKTEPQVAIDRTAYNELVRRRDELDPAAPSAYDTANEVQSVGAFTGTFTGGNYTLTIAPPGVSALTTANIAHNANAATVEGALNTVCTGNIVGWTNGDISVAGGDLTSAPLTLAFDGILTQKNMGATVIADVDLTDGSANAANTITTNQGTITFTADAVGTAYNGEIIYLSDTGSLSVTYNTANTTFLITYNGGTTNHTQVETEVDTNMTANPTWPQFECSTTNGANTVDAADDTLNATTVGGLDVGALGSVSTTTAGQPPRYPWAVMWALGLINATDLPDYGESLASDVTLWGPASQNPRYPNAALRGVLAEQAAHDDANATLETQLKALFHVQ